LINNTLAYFKSRDFLIHCFLFFTSLIFLLFCTESSPLYPFNTWSDADAFFTMGNGMVNGKVLYKDLFEQKGPYLYLIHAASYVISHRTFFGVFIFEVISFFVFLIYAFKTFCLFLKEKVSLSLIFVLSALLISSTSFSHGDSAEEFCLPFLMISLYHLMVYFKKDYPQPICYKILLSNGVIAGIVLCIKFSLLGFWIGWTLSIGIALLIRKYYIKTIYSAFIFIFGMMVATLPWFIYFGVNHAISDWLNDYFLINIKDYSIPMSFDQHVYYILSSFYREFNRNIVYGVIFLLGLFILVSKRILPNALSKLSVLLTLSCLISGIYIGGRAYVYYFFIASPFVIFGLITLFYYLTEQTKWFKLNKVVILCLIVFPFFITILSNQNIHWMFKKRSDLIQYSFASIIKKTPHGSVLNYGAGDIGLYIVLDMTPNVKFFENQNIDYSLFPKILDSQDDYVRSGLFDYVVVVQNRLPFLKEKVANFSQRYKLVSTQDEELEKGFYATYFLYKKIN
jgi:hypothetical protein